MHPPFPWVVKIGTPTLLIESISLYIVLTDTSNLSASSFAVTFSFSKI